MCRFMRIVTKFRTPIRIRKFLLTPHAGARTPARSLRF
jgi:hypothetical protein